MYLTFIILSLSSIYLIINHIFEIKCSCKIRTRYDDKDSDSSDNTVVHNESSDDYENTDDEESNGPKESSESSESNESSEVNENKQTPEEEANDEQEIDKKVTELNNLIKLSKELNQEDVVDGIVDKVMNDIVADRELTKIN